MSIKSGISYLIEIDVAYEEANEGHDVDDDERHQKVNDAAVDVNDVEGGVKHDVR